jgi:GAF domain-containing protein/HAMP domain-containing protein
MRPKSLSLRWRLVIIMGLLPLLILLPVSVYVGGRYQAQYRDVRLSKGEMVARQFAQTLRALSPYISTIHDLPDLGSYLRGSIEEQPELAFAAVVLENGLAVYHSVPGKGNSLVPGLADLDEASSPVIRPVVPYEEAYLVFEEVRLPQSDQTLYIVVGEPAMVVDPPLLAVAPLLVLFGLETILVIGLLFFLQRMVVQPLQKLSEGVSIIGAGDLQYKIDVGREDEIGFLAHAFNEMGDRLRDLIVSLERQVRERTTALERRGRQLEAVAFVSREATQVREVSLLLETTVTAISEQFGFYHVGIFLLDDKGEWAVLRAASSEGGQRMLARRHRLRIGQQGIVGNVARYGEPRIALDVGEDAVWFDTPELSETHSEMALPLVSRDQQVVGILDVQSTERDAFSDDDIEILQLLADQVSVALQNARLLEQTRSALTELETLQREQRRRGWARVVNRMRPQAYEYDRVDVHPVLPMPVPTDLVEGSAAHQMIVDGGSPYLMEPMRYRDETLAVLSLSDPERVWTEEEMELVKSVSEQVAIALENARLFEETQRTARQQELLNLVLQTASTTTNAEEALRKIALILAEGLDMAVAVFTYQDLEVGAVLPQAIVLPDGTEALQEPQPFVLPPDMRIFFNGLSRPELGKPLPLFKELDFAEEYALHRVLYVAIRSAVAQIGFVAMIRHGKDQLLDPDTRELASALANQVAVVVENINLLAETQQRSEELQLLFSASADLNLAQSYDDVLAALQQHTILGEADNNISLNLFDRPWAGDDIPEWSIPVARWTALDSQALGGRYRLEDFPSAIRLLHPDRPTVVEDVAQDDRLDDSARALYMQRFKAKSTIFAPLVVGGRWIGYVNAIYGEKTHFAEADLRRLSSLAAQAAVAVQNQYQLRATAARARREQLIREISGELQSASDVQDVLRKAAQEVGKALQARRTTVHLGGPEWQRQRKPDTGPLSRPGTGPLTPLVQQADSNSTEDQDEDA